MQSLIRLAFPPTCVGCTAAVEQDFGLCGSCWKETPFITGLTCSLCGVPLPGEDESLPVHCDDCMVIARPWDRGKAALLYKDKARELVLAFKHGDRLDLTKPLAAWLVGAGASLVYEDTVIVPIPAHSVRLLQRRYNQAAILAQALSRQVKRPVIPDLLLRKRQTNVQDGMTREERFANVSGAIHPHNHAASRLGGRAVLLVDDVMTSGATFAAATEACYAVGARIVDVLALARVAKDT